jgi:hypothetical protein
MLDRQEGRQPTDAEISAGFAEFFGQFPRAVDKGKAKIEYSKAIKAGKVTIVQLQDAVKLYAAARREANQDHYTKTPANWLANECWGDDPNAHALGARSGWTPNRLADAAAAAERARQEGKERFRRATTLTPPEPDPRWTRIREALAAELDRNIFERFFTDLKFERIECDVVVLRTPAPYDARKIMAEYHDLLLKLWRAENENVQSIKVVV